VKLIKWLLILALVVVGGAYLYGRTLPREHTASSTIVLVASADTVWSVIRNVKGATAWWSDLKSATRVSGAMRETWDEDMGPMGTIRIEISAEDPPRRLVTTILGAEEQGWGGTWTYTITSAQSTTEVTITEKGFVNSPIMRVFMGALGEHRTMDSYLRDLAGHFGEATTPRHGNR
jgi:uncharacterized protein YndB with AHSA1/START domain